MKHGGFVRLYYEVMEMDISGRAKFLYSIAASFTEDGKSLTMSNALLAKYLSCDPRSIRRTIKELEDNGLIKVSIKNNFERDIMSIPMDKVSGGGGQDVHTPMDNMSTYKIKDNKNNYNREIKEIVSYLNSQAKRRYRDNTVSSIRPITARLNEGFTIDEFKRVIDIMVEKWADDDHMKQYLRPETLFSNKFDGYLNSTEAPEILCHLCNSSIRDGKCINCGEPYNG